jgi:hypothetical protein
MNVQFWLEGKRLNLEPTMSGSGSPIIPPIGAKVIADRTGSTHEVIAQLWDYPMGRILVMLK